MKGNLLLLILVISVASAYSQTIVVEKPDYKKIEEAIADKASELYYVKLMIRYRLADTTMTLEEKRHLYYGYSFQKEYSPYGRSDYEDKLREVLNNGKLRTSDYQKIVVFSDSILAENPFNLAVIDNQLFAFEKLGDSGRFNENITRLKIVVDAMLSSGDGLSKESAYYVISTAHEYFILNMLGLTFGGSQSLQEHYDYLTVAKNPDKIKGLYFDVSPCLQSLQKSFR